MEPQDRIQPSEVYMKIEVTVVCPHCSNQMTHKASSSGTINVTCRMGRGGCGKSFRVCISSGQLNWVK